MDSRVVTIDVNYPLTDAEVTSFQELLREYECDGEMVISGFVSRNAYPEEAFPHYPAEIKLMEIIDEVHQLKDVTIAKCIFESRMFKITLSVSRESFMRFINGRK